jgi:hypothetical protein
MEGKVQIAFLFIHVARMHDGNTPSRGHAIGLILSDDGELEMAIFLNEVCDIGFDYAALEPDIASEAKDAAERIHNIRRQTTAGIIETGERLKTIKDRLPHGQFQPWLAAEFGMSDRAARLYMNAANFAAGKTETVSVLQPTTVYALAAPSTPDAVKTGVLERLEKGEAVTDREVKQLIAHAKDERKEAADPKAQPAAETKFTGIVAAESGDNIWHVEPVNPDHEATAPAVEVERDPLAAAIHAVKILSADDLADFDRWYRDAYQVAADPEAIDGDAVPGDDVNQLTPPQTHAPEQDEVDIEDDPLITMWRGFKVRSQESACYWVVNGAPEVVPWNELSAITDRLAPWRVDYRAAPPERQQAIRLWLEKHPPEQCWTG